MPLLQVCFGMFWLRANINKTNQCGMLERQQVNALHYRQARRKFDEIGYNACFSHQMHVTEYLKIPKIIILKLEAFEKKHFFSCTGVRKSQNRFLRLIRSLVGPISGCLLNIQEPQEDSETIFGLREHIKNYIADSLPP